MGEPIKPEALRRTAEVASEQKEPPKCGGCAFYQPGADATRGDCRRSPPKLQAESDIDGNSWWGSAWPPCGIG